MRIAGERVIVGGIDDVWWGATMKRIILGVIALALAGCGDDRGACLYGVYDGLVCYENATASCCQQIYGEFHSGESCSKYGGRIEPASYAGCH